ncbi:MAG: PAS domain-containing protein [Candidatus Synoicihabitans palmerolidicus]|nr:PAS domain-containing protein [Candidatus Synoicihabitans palmerolidicus]
METIPNSAPPHVVAPDALSEQEEPWVDLNSLPTAWSGAISRGQSLEGNLSDLGVPPHIVLDPSGGTPWVITENIELRGKPWGTLLIVFPHRSLSTHGETRDALRAMVNSFSFCLAREERSEHLAAAEERLRTIIETSPDGFWDADYTRDTCFRTHRWWQMLGHQTPVNPSAPEAFESLIHPEDLPLLQKDRLQTLPAGRQLRRHEYRARHVDGSWRWIESHTVELGSAQRAIGFDRDITHRHDYEARLRDAADSAARANQAKS